MQPYAGATGQKQVLAIDEIRQALQKLFGCTFISTDRLSPSLSPARERERECPLTLSATVSKQNNNVCPNVLPAEGLLESGEVLYVILPYTQYSLHDIVTYSPAKLANSNAKVLFILYQVLIAMRECHASGLSCGELSLQDVSVDEQLCSRLRISLAHYEELDATVSKIHRSINLKSQVKEQHCLDCQDHLKSLTLNWIHGQVSNFDYLMELNRLAGRREGDPNYHPVLPWVVDFTAPYGRFRDLRRSKFRLNKGDKQLDFTYEMTKEALAAALNAGGGSVFTSEPGTSVGPIGPGTSDHLHVPHHISDVLSDITYYVYKARQTPKSVLCCHVRSQWEPNEYPSSMERIQSWTPDECIPEFYTDPSIFQSIHADMSDLEIPSWCSSTKEFITVHRQLLDSREVSQHLHHWIDLTFGYKLSGKESVKAKNVCLHLVDNHTHLTSYGVVQLFDQPHPPCLAPFQYSPAEPPHLGPINVSAWQVPLLETTTDVDGMVPEATGCESSGWTMVDRDEELEQGTEALDSLTTSGPSTSNTVPVPVPTGGKTVAEHASLASPSHGSFPGESLTSTTNALGFGIRSAVLQRSAATVKKQDANAAVFKITLPEGFKPLQPLEELEKLNNFLVKGLHSEIHSTVDLVREDSSAQSKALLFITDLFHRDMQALGVFIAEIFFSSKLRCHKPDMPLRGRYDAVIKLCSSSLRDVPLPLHHAIESLLQIQKHKTKKDSPNSSSYQSFLFKYDPIFEGLPPPNPRQLLSPVLSPLPFPEYFPALHHFIFSYHYKIESMNSIQGRDIVFNLWQQLQSLLQGEITAEGLEILLPFVLGLMTEESTAVYAAWYLFEPVSSVLGPRNASKYLIKPLIGVYENPCCLRGRFYLYTDCFVLQLIMRLGLHTFLSSLLPHVLQVLIGFESCQLGTGNEWDGLKGLRGAMGGSGDEEEDYDCSNDGASSAASGGKVGAGSGGGGGGVGDPALVDYSSGISLNDQVFMADGEDFQNGFYVNNGSSVPAAEVSSKQQNQNSTHKDQDQESLSVGKLSDKSSASEVSIGDGDSSKDRASLKSADSSQDLKQASDGEDGVELDDEDATVEDKEGQAQKVPSSEMTLSGCTEESDATVGTLEGDFMNGMVQEECEKSIAVEDNEPDPSEDSEEKEHKILLGKSFCFVF